MVATSAPLAAAMCSPVAAEIRTVAAQGSVTEAVDRLQAAVEAAGATVVARVDHGAAAAAAGMQLGEAQLLIFGNPKVGTPVMQVDPAAGLFLPIRVLAYADADGATVFAFEDAASMVEGAAVAPDDPSLAAIDKAVSGLVGKAAAP
jgi:uncharacterized protein (DUF302 family)